LDLTKGEKHQPECRHGQEPPLQRRKEAMFATKKTNGPRPNSDYVSTSWKGQLLRYRQEARRADGPSRGYHWLTHLARQVPIPRHFGTTLERSELRERLYKLCLRLQDLQWLPPEIIQTTSGGMISAMGTAGYRIDRKRRYVSGCRILPHGQASPDEFRVELLRPLYRAEWIHWLIDDLKLSYGGEQLDLFMTAHLCRERNTWLAETAYQLLLTDTKFHKLRTKRLPESICLNPDLVRIALKARTRTNGWHLDSGLYSLVWNHDEHFRQVERENPQLLPLLTAFLRESRPPLDEDPIKEMRAFFLDQGLSKATWRYLVLHGCRIFRQPWQVARCGTKIKPAIEYLRTLEQAGLPLPPTPSAAGILLRAAADIEEGQVYFGKQWCLVDHDVLAVALRQAARISATPALQSFLPKLREVLFWAKDTQPALDANQRHAGWPWLARQSRTWSEKRGVMVQASDLEWKSRMGQLEGRKYQILPLCSERDLIAEGIAMRNCIADYVVDCASNRMRLFSVRSAATGKRVADIGILKVDKEVWMMCDVAGKANTEVNKGIRELAYYVAQRYNVSRGDEDTRLPSWIEDLDDQTVTKNEQQTA
jgi:hypothetical protein